jgi:hypothetical protein
LPIRLSETPVVKGRIFHDFDGIHFVSVLLESRSSRFSCVSASVKKKRANLCRFQIVHERVVFDDVFDFVNRSRDDFYFEREFFFDCCFDSVGEFFIVGFCRFQKSRCRC